MDGNPGNQRGLIYYSCDGILSISWMHLLNEQRSIMKYMRICSSTPSTGSPLMISKDSLDKLVSVIFYSVSAQLDARTKTFICTWGSALFVCMCSAFLNSRIGVTEKVVLIIIKHSIFVFIYANKKLSFAGVRCFLCEIPVS